MKAIFVILLSNLIFFSLEKNKTEWKTRAIYQLLTDRFAHGDGSKPDCDLKKYCGGNFKGIQNNLDYIKGMGFDAIWISPVSENFEGEIEGFESYHGYHMTKIYNINPHFGTKEELKELIKACHDKDIWVMADVVANHVGPVGFDYSSIDPFNSTEHYHEYCLIEDWSDQYQVENCRLADLPDLKQENEFVEKELLKWINWLVNEFGFDGVRIDTIVEVPKWFWKNFSEAAGVFGMGECYNGNAAYVADYQRSVDSLLNYPLYFNLKAAFSGSMYKLEEYINQMRIAFPNPELLGVFIENHDNPRFLNEIKDRHKFKNAVIFNLMYEGIPVFYYGGEQWFDGGADPENREPLWNHFDNTSELYKAISITNKIRKDKYIWTKKLVQRYADDVFYAFTRGEVLVCISRGEPCKREITYHEFSEGSKLCNAFDRNDCVFVENNKIIIDLGYDPKIYVLEPNSNKEDSESLLLEDNTKEEIIQ